MKNIIIAFLLLLSTEISEARGIHVLVFPGSGDNLINEILSHPDVEAISVRTYWNRVEPSEGVYDWSYLDHAVSLAESKNKKVTLRLIKGLVGGQGGLPSWLILKGVVTYTCKAGDDIGTVGPLPWDSIYIRRWTKVQRAMIERYTNNPVVIGFQVSGWYTWRNADSNLCPPFSQSDIDGFIAAGYANWRIKRTAVKILNGLVPYTTKPLFYAAAGKMLDSSLGIRTHDAMLDNVIIPIDMNFNTAGMKLWLGSTGLSDRTSDPYRFWNQKPLLPTYQAIHNRRPFNWMQRDKNLEGTFTHTYEEWTKIVDISLHYGANHLEISRLELKDPEFAPIWACASEAFKINGHCGH